ncbi:MAG: helix-turn-helix transcriptional regulator [Rhodospirillales bacterium]|nr:helix-turn-helix transcriptional regulator [Rhodospirillales bacterium]
MGRTKNDEQRIAELIGSFYDAAMDSKLWAGIGPAIAETMHSPSTALYVHSTRRPSHWLSRTANIDEAAQSYDAYYHKTDVWAQRGGQMEKSRVVFGHELISEREFEETEFYQDWCRKTGQFRVLGTVFDIEGGDVGICGVHRPIWSRMFSEDERQRLGRIFPHLKRALQLRNRFLSEQIEGRASLVALDRTRMAVLVVDRECRILYANGAADDLLRRGDAIRAPLGRIKADSSAQTNDLERLIRAAADTAAGKGKGTGGSLIMKRRDRLPVTVSVAPFRGANAGVTTLEPAAIVLVRDPQKATADAAILEELFGLTAREAAVATRLADGRSIEEVAVERGVSINTARTHLKSIFVKTGTNRQAELVALLLQSVAMLGGTGPLTRR